MAPTNRLAAHSRQESQGVFSAFRRFAQRVIVDSTLARYLFDRLAARPESVAFVARLVGAWHPLAVRRLVVAVNVFALKREAFRAFAHIGVKLSEAVTPRLAHCYPAAAIVSVVRRCFPEAPSFGVVPRQVFSAPSHSMGSARLSGGATTAKSLAKVGRVNGVTLATIATAFPFCLAAHWFDRGDFAGSLARVDW